MEAFDIPTSDMKTILLWRNDVFQSFGSQINDSLGKPGTTKYDGMRYDILQFCVILSVFDVRLLVNITSHLSTWTL